MSYHGSHARAGESHRKLRSHLDQLDYTLKGALGLRDSVYSTLGIVLGRLAHFSFQLEMM